MFFWVVNFLVDRPVQAAAIAVVVASVDDNPGDELFNPEFELENERQTINLVSVIGPHGEVLPLTWRN